MPRLQIPTTELEILSLLSNGSLEESFEVEIKQSANNDLIAMTLASLAIKGGTFILGLGEQKGSGGQTFVSVPHALKGILERIDNVARNLIDPPILVESSVVKSEEDPSLGYIFVTVAASPSAPHAVDGRYYARSGASRVRLSHSELKQFHSRNAEREDVIPRLLTEEEDRDPIPKDSRKFGHFYLVAEPCGETRGAFHLMDHAKARGIFSREEKPLHAPTIHQMTPYSIFNQGSGRPGGIKLVSGALRHLDLKADDLPKERELASIELRKTGGIRVFHGGATDDQLHYEEDTWIMDNVMVHYTFQLLHWMKVVSSEMGYEGAWDIGIRATRLQGRKSQSRVECHFDSPNQFRMADDTYDQPALGVRSYELHNSTPAIAGALLSDLLAVLGSGDLIPRVKAA
jgi:hypothetical protein